MSNKISKELSKHRLQQAKDEIFPKEMGRKISIASRMREDSDYEDEFVVEADNTKEQIETAKELLDLVEKYINE